MFNFGINNKKVHFKLTGDSKRNSRNKGGFRLNFAENNKAKSNERNVESPLFGKITVPDQRKFLGMSNKMRIKFYVLIIAIIGLILLIGDNLLATLAEINEANKQAMDDSKQKAYESLYKNTGESGVTPNISTVEQNSDNPDGIQLPSYEPLEDEYVDDKTDDPDNNTAQPQSQPNKNDEDNEDTIEEKPETNEIPKVDDSDVTLDENGYKPSVTLPVGVYENVDYKADENPLLHTELLLKMNSLSETQIMKLANPYHQIKKAGEIVNTWYATYKNSAKLKDYTGKIFEIEATIFKLEKQKVDYYNIKSDELNNRTEVWQGVLAFRYLKSYPIGNKQEDKLQDEIGFVSFTALELPEWLTQDRVYDMKQLPLRGKFYGAFYGVPYADANVLEGEKHKPIAMPHLVLGIAEETESIKPEVNRELLNRVYDGNSYTMRDVPMLALLNILYTLKYMPESEKAELMKKVDKTIGYYDLLNNPPVMRKVMPVVRFRGELGKIVSESEPLMNYVNIKPNPYNIRQFKLGAIRLTEYDKPQNLIFDTMDIEIIDPSTGKYVPEGTPVSPETGQKIKRPYLRAGDSVEIYGYMLFNWSYLSQEHEFITAPRIVAFKVRQLPIREEDTSYLNWIFLVVVVVVIVIVIVLVRKERKKATEFRSQFFRSHMKKPGAIEAKLDKSNAVTPLKDAKTEDDSNDSDKTEGNEPDAE